MVPLLEFMPVIIPNLESLSLRDYVTYPATTPPVTSTPDILEEMDMDEFTFDPNGLFLAIGQWASIKDLEIYGLDLSDDMPSRPEMLNYIKALNELETLVLYGIGLATSIAYTLFIHASDSGQPLLPKLSRFLLAITQMSPNHDLYHYIINRQCHQLPRLQKLSINLAYIQHLTDMHPSRINILQESGDDIFVIADPEVGKFIPIEEVNLRDFQTI
jgi:hypothetical protein